MDVYLGIPAPIDELRLLVEQGHGDRTAALTGCLLVTAPKCLPIEHLVASVRVGQCLMAIRMFPEGYTVSPDALLSALQEEGLKKLPASRDRRAFRRYVHRIRRVVEEAAHVD